MAGVHDYFLLLMICQETFPSCIAPASCLKINILRIWGIFIYLLILYGISKEIIIPCFSLLLPWFSVCWHVAKFGWWRQEPNQGYRWPDHSGEQTTREAGVHVTATPRGMFSSMAFLTIWLSATILCSRYDACLSARSYQCHCNSLYIDCLIHFLLKHLSLSSYHHLVCSV